MPTPAETLAQSLAKLQTANRIDGNRNSFKKDSPLEYQGVIAYLNGGTRPQVASDMGVGLVLAEDARRALLVTPEPEPEPEPEPLPGYALAEFLDFHSDNNYWGHTNGDITINRYAPRNLGSGNYYYFQPANATVPPWTDWTNPDGGIEELQTPHGPGFKVVVYDYMTVPSGGKMAFICDVDWLIDRQNFLGRTQEWSGKFMFPAGGQTNPLSAGGLVWEFHTQSMSGNHISVEQSGGNAGKLRFGFYSGSGTYNTYYDSKPVVLDHWYEWRMQIKWSTGSDGLCKGWLDGALIADQTGPSILGGESPYLQFGFYKIFGTGRNEVHHADVRVSNPSKAP